jgi:hypothetical protein
MRAAVDATLSEGLPMLRSLDVAVEGSVQEIFGRGFSYFRRYTVMHMDTF